MAPQKLVFIHHVFLFNVDEIPTGLEYYYKNRELNFLQSLLLLLCDLEYSPETFECIKLFCEYHRDIFIDILSQLCTSAIKSSNTNLLCFLFDISPSATEQISILNAIIDTAETDTFISLFLSVLLEKHGDDMLQLSLKNNLSDTIRETILKLLEEKKRSNNMEIET